MRTHSELRGTIAVMICLLLLQLPVGGTNAPLGKVVPRAGSSLVNGVALHLETTLFSGDSVVTQSDGLALIFLSQGGQVHLGPETSATVSAGENELVVSLERGLTLARSGNTPLVSVNARGLLVRPVGLALYEVAIAGDAVLVSARTGSVQVVGSNKSFEVPAGKAMKFELAANTAPGRVGAGAHNITPETAVVIAVAASAGIALGVALPIALSQSEDDAQEICERIKKQISPSFAGGNINCN